MLCREGDTKVMREVSEKELMEITQKCLELSRQNVSFHFLFEVFFFLTLYKKKTHWDHKKII